MKKLLKWLSECGVEDISQAQPRDYLKKTPPTLQPQINSTTILDTSTILSDACQNLFDLEKAYINFDGCRLKKTAKSTLFNPNQKTGGIMVIADCPTLEDDQSGIIFSADIGTLFDKMFGAIGLNRNDFFISYFVPWRPAGDKPLTETDMDLCFPLIRKQIQLVNPKIIITLSDGITQKLLQTNEPILSVHGQFKNYEGYPVYPLFHPSFLMKFPKQKAKAWEDLKKLQIELQK